MHTHRLDACKRIKNSFFLQMPAAPSVPLWGSDFYDLTGEQLKYIRRAFYYSILLLSIYKNLKWRRTWGEKPSLDLAWSPKWIESPSPKVLQIHNTSPQRTRRGETINEAVDYYLLFSSDRPRGVFRDGDKCFVLKEAANTWHLRIFYLTFPFRKIQLNHKGLT